MPIEDWPSASPSASVAPLPDPLTLSPIARPPTRDRQWFQCATVMALGNLLCLAFAVASTEREAIGLVNKLGLEFLPRWQRILADAVIK